MWYSGQTDEMLCELANIKILSHYSPYGLQVLEKVDFEVCLSSIAASSDSDLLISWRT